MNPSNLRPHQSGSPNLSWLNRTSAGAGLLLLAGGTLYVSTLTAQLGLFPTLFAALVIAACVAMQLAELFSPHQPQH